MNKTYFETIKIENGKIHNIQYHKQRIFNTIGKTYPLENMLKAPNNSLLKCKVIYTENEIIKIEYHPYKKKSIKTLKIVYDDSINYCTKSTNREKIEALYAKKETCDEIIIVKNDLITDTSIANICILKDGLWHTPEKPLLKGTMRESLLDQKKLLLSSISTDELKNAEGLALCNAMIGFNQIDHYKILD
jgi:4-amino-4-deoxychorismate lyase